MIEKIDKRTRNSKTHELSPNKFALDCSIGSVHYKDVQGQWQEIDNIFEPAVAPWNWGMDKAEYHIKVKNDFTAGQIIQFEVQDETVEFQPMALEWTNDLDQIQQISMPANVSPTVTNPTAEILTNVQSHQGTIRWNGAYGTGTHFQWQCTPSRLTKILQIDSLASLPTPQAFIITGGNPVLRLNLIFAPSKNMDIYVDGALWNQKDKKQTFGIIEFRKGTEILWGFMPLRYWGSGQDPETNEGQSVATLEKRGNKLYISIRVPYSWLQSATFPVFIDTDVDEQVGAGADDGGFDTSGSVASWQAATGYFGAGNSYKYVDTTCSAFYRFASVTISNGASITTAYVSLYGNVNGGVGSPLTKVFAEDTSAPTAPNTEANHAGRTRTTSGVDWDGLLTAGNWGNSPDISTVIQELVDSYNYSSGSAMLILQDDDGSPTGAKHYQTAEAYETNTTHAPKLHIEYSAGGGVTFTPKMMTVI